MEKGDMLFYPQNYQKPARLQGAFVKDSEVEQVVEFLTQQNNPETYNAEMQVQLSQVTQAAQDLKNSGSDVDEYFADAGKFIIEKDKASIGMLQRVFKIGFNRAARIMDQLSDAGVVGPEEGTKPRKVLMSMEQSSKIILSRGNKYVLYFNVVFCRTLRDCIQKTQSGVLFIKRKYGGMICTRF